MATAEAEDLTRDLTVVDGEVHTGESRRDLLEYLPEEVRSDEEDGYMFAPEAFGPIPWDGWDRTAGGRIHMDNYSVPTAEEFDAQRERFGVDRVVFSPGPAFRISLVPDHRTRVAYMQAYNSLVLDRFARGDGTYYAKMIGLAEHPAETAEEIERVGDEDGIVGVFVTDVGPTQPLGHRRSDPMFAAAEEHDLPIILHSTTGIVAGFPIAGMQPTNFAEFHTLAHTIPKMWHANSLIQRGIPERYDVDFGFWEGGLSWVPALAERLDREYLERSNEFAELSKLPSEYLSEFYYGTQPLPEEATTMVDIPDLLERANLEDQVVYTSDRPHQDFDAPAAIENIEGLSDEQRRKILHDNAAELFGL
jgi:predicted TIM-barrel fold metal-dependent hydrolase